MTCKNLSRGYVCECKLYECPNLVIYNRYLYLCVYSSRDQSPLCSFCIVITMLCQTNLCKNQF